MQVFKVLIERLWNRHGNDTGGRKRISTANLSRAFSSQ